MRGFHRTAGRYVAGLDGSEREVLATVVADVAELLGAERFGQDPDAARAAGASEAAAASQPLLGLRMSSVAVPAPVDPAVHRLLPDASDDDPALAAEFRRLTEGDLRGVKIERLRAFWLALTAAPPGGPSRRGTSDLVVDPAEAAEVAATITDLRLVLADRLGIETEEDSDALYAALERTEAADGVADDPDRPGRDVLADEIREYLGSVYAALSWLQESLLAVMIEDLP
ncbi:DUF2017 family protein [Pengzhenrongella sicca]|uniref:DUF2017 family protein n=1 Tax=Pengzhenrongella sicca TaxID=2819238 RepID=A0A8A4ZIS6_9MICO|nr:DUF2017 family protein [Pengzhenrongella sicca]QTE30406.1 DUF2017 family protein [Pengzhenrongella sicca]